MTLDFGPFTSFEGGWFLGCARSDSEVRLAGAWILDL